MYGKAALLSAIVSSLALLASAADSRTYWVLADAALVRNRPDAKAPAKGTLRTGTYLEARKVSGDWIYLDSVAMQPMGGWIHQSLVSETEVNEYLIMARLSEAGTLADSIMWNERLLSIIPSLDYSNHLHKRRPEIMNSLLEGYTASGDTARAAHMGRQIRGTDPTYLAHCQGKDLLVIGYLDSIGEFHSMLWQETLNPESRGLDSRNVSSEAVKRNAMRLRMTMAYMEWFTPAMGVEPHSKGTIFRSAKIVPPENDASGYIQDVEGTATFGISLAQSNHYICKEAVFSTKPAHLVPVSGFTRKTELDSIGWYRERLVGNGFDKTGLAGIEYRKLREYGYVDVSVSDAIPGGYRNASQRGVFDRDRKLVWPQAGKAGGSIDLDREHPQYEPQWFRFGPDAGFPAFILLPFNGNNGPPDYTGENGDYGYHLLKIDKKATKVFVVRSDYGGC